MRLTFSAIGRSTLGIFVLLLASHSHAKETKKKKDAAPEVIDLDESESEPEEVILEETPVEESSDEFSFDSEEEADKDGAHAFPSPLEIQFTLGAIGRELHFRDTSRELNLPDNSPPYDNMVGAAFLPQLAGRWYPAAHFTGGALAHLGLGFSYARSFKNTTEYELDGGPANYNHTYQLFTAGLTARIPLDILTLGVDANYGSQSMWVRPENAMVSDNVYPDVSYSHIEGRLRAELRLKGLGLSGYFGYLHVLSLGEIAEPAWYENAKAMGLVYGGQIGYRIHPSWELIGGVDFRQYRLNFNPLDPVSAPHIAGGASDRYLSFRFGVQFNLPGKSAAGSTATEGSDEPAAESESESGSDSFDSFD